MKIIIKISKSKITSVVLGVINNYPMKKIIVLSVITLIFGCKETSKKVEEAVVEVKKQVVKGNSFTSSIEKAHQKDVFLSKNAISYNIEVAFGGSTILDGMVTQLTNGAKIRIDEKNGTKVIFDNKETFICPKDAVDPMARFHIFTWAYFFSLPYKLNDDGTIWSGVSNRNWGKAKFMYPTAKLTFEAGTGDAPDDWYVVYKHPETDVLEGAAYIVSFGKDLATAEKEPHAIKFSNFTTVDGVPFATNWTFHMWSEAEGYGDQIGEAKLTNIKFLGNIEALFNRPENSKLIEKPNN